MMFHIRVNSAPSFVRKSMLAGLFSSAGRVILCFERPDSLFATPEVGRKTRG
jgi:hypothetical protein